MSRINISHVNNMHNQWLRTLNFYKTEMVILRGILTEIAGKNSDAAMLKEVEQFENQFKVQTDNIDVIAHSIHVNIDTMSKEVQNSSAGYIDGQLVADHTILGNKTEEEEKTMLNIIRSFRKFAEQWM
ncbi:MAG: hypothetical protein JWQ38_3334 [Flavipsychrobacter sp.]|nr:hypothetical protein [Flavipsychrobacter sp.]